MNIDNLHYVSGHPLKPPFPQGLQWVIVGTGCFWGAERRFWQQPGVFTTAAGYAGGYTANPSYDEVCSGRTGHSEVVLVVFDPHVISYQKLLSVFWESHDPTQGMRQGNDIGTQYRSVIYCRDREQLAATEASLVEVQAGLNDLCYPGITTEIRMSPEFLSLIHI